VRATLIGSVGLLALVLAGGCGSPGVADASSRDTTTTTAEATTTSTTTSTTVAPPGDDPLTAADVQALIEAAPAPYDSHWTADLSTYDPGVELSAVVASLWGATVSSPQQVFFFHLGRPVDLPVDPRSGVEIAAVEGDTVTLTYAHYEPSDPSCCPSLPDYRVRVRWDGRDLVVLDPVPPADQGTAG
jgi:hypothetical protein